MALVIRLISVTLLTIQHFKRHFESWQTHTDQTHMHKEPCSVSRPLQLLSATTMLGLQFPTLTACLSCFNIHQIRWGKHFIFLKRAMEWESSGFQTQQWTIITFVSTYCSWCLIKVTLSALENKIYKVIPFFFFCFQRRISEGFHWKAVRCDRRNGFFHNPRRFCLWPAFFP